MVSPDNIQAKTPFEWCFHGMVVHSANEFLVILGGKSQIIITHEGLYISCSHQMTEGSQRITEAIRQMPSKLRSYQLRWKERCANPENRGRAPFTEWTLDASKIATTHTSDKAIPAQKLELWR